MYKNNVPGKIRKYKNQRRDLMQKYLRIRLILSMRMISGLFYIETLLTKIKLAKQIFVLDIE